MSPTRLEDRGRRKVFMSRLQIDTTAAMDQLLEELVKVTGAGSKKELFNNALTFLDWAVKEVRKGRSIASVSEADGSYRDLQMPALMHAARYSEINGDAQEKQQSQPALARKVA